MNVARGKDSKTNEYIMTSVFIALFVPGLILLTILCIRSIRRARKTESSFLLGLIIFLMDIMFLGKIIQGIVFLVVKFQDIGTNSVADAFVRYWSPYLSLCLQYVILSLLLCLWEALITKVSGKYIRFSIKIIVLSANIILIAFTVLLLSIIRPVGDHGSHNPDATLFKQIMLGALLFCAVVLLPLYIYVWIKLRKGLHSLNNAVASTFARRIGIFSFILIAIFIVRILLEIIILFVASGDSLFMRSFEFLNHSLPELVMSYTFIGIVWRGFLNEKRQEEKDTMDLEETVVQQEE